MRKLFLLIAFVNFIIFLSPNFSCAQKEKNKTKIEEAEDLSFPNGWLGRWTGNLDIFKGPAKVQTIPMELVMHKIDSSENRYKWSIIYGEDKIEGLRPYELVVIDPEKGHYLLDEKNTIEIECYYTAGKLISWYMVQGSLILCTYELKGDQMIFEIVAGTNIPVSVSGGQKVQEEIIPEVETYPVNVVQTAVLNRVEE